MSFKNRWTISSSYDFQAHQQRSERKCCFPRLLYFDSRSTQTCRWRTQTCRRRCLDCPRRSQACGQYSQVHPKFGPALWGVPKPITVTPMVLLYQSSEIPVTLTAGRNALIGSDTLPKLTHLSSHSKSSQTLLEASRDQNTFCWCSAVRDRSEWVC